MYSVTGRIAVIKQPRGGYIKPSQFKEISINDNCVLNENENVHGSIIGITVDYLTRFALGTNKEDAFIISLLGADIAEQHGREDYVDAANMFLNNITGLDDKSIISACKLATFDVWYRNTGNAFLAKSYQETNPDKETIQNIQTLVNRSVAFFKEYGPITEDGFSFEPEKENLAAYEKMICSRKGSYGGYTATVAAGDGDFLTADTLWDFKVSKSKPTNKHTLQLLMYWIMGQHSGQKIYKSITKLGIFNPRLNTVYLLDVNDIPVEVIKEVERDVICY